MEDETLEETASKTYQKRYDWLKPHQFVAGGPGGPGRPKGPTLKTWISERFSEMTDEERIEFLNQIEPIKAWEMAEGKPKQDTDVMSGGKAINIIIPPQLAEAFNINESNTQTSGGNTE